MSAAAAAHSLAGAGAARAAAREILGESRFHQSGVPHPLHGALIAVGHVLESPLSWINSLVASAATVIPGGVTGVWIVFGSALVVAAIAVITRIGRERLESEDRPGPVNRTSAAELERLATAAQADGQLDLAVRLRFRAGLARLAERDTIPAASTRPTVEISRALDSPRFDGLARRFDEIAYGASPANPGDVEQQRRDWPEILRAGSSSAGPRP